jgi:hypothetical protein
LLSLQIDQLIKKVLSEKTPTIFDHITDFLSKKGGLRTLGREEFY